MHRTSLAVSISDHPVLDILALATSRWKRMYSIQSEDITCPACEGKHRAQSKNVARIQEANTLAETGQSKKPIFTNGVRLCRDFQLEEKSEVKQEPKLEEG